MAQNIDLTKFEIIDAKTFKKSLKVLSKRFRHIEKDVDDFFASLKTTSDLGSSLGDGYYKATLKTSAKMSSTS